MTELIVPDGIELRHQKPAIAGVFGVSALSQCASAEIDTFKRKKAQRLLYQTNLLYICSNLKKRIMIPDFNDKGYLDPGIYEATFEEVKSKGRIWTIV